MKKTILLLARMTLACDRNIAGRACPWATLGLFAVFALGLHPARAAVTEAWVHRYNRSVASTADNAVKVARDAAGDIIVTGSTDDGIGGSDIVTIKYSGTDGSELWQKRYSSPANGYDQAAGLALDESGNVVVTGYSSGTNGYADYYTAKYAASDGALLWEKGYDGPANGWDEAQSVVVDGHGNVAVTGYSQNGTNYDYYTAEYAAADGTLLWEQRYNGPANGEDHALAVAVDSNANVVVTGYSVGTGSDYDCYTAKYAAADGALLWERRYNGAGNDQDIAYAVAVDGSDNVVVTGYSVGTNLFSDCYTAKYAAADGVLLWEKRYSGPANSYNSGSAVAVDSSGNVVVTGYSAGTNLFSDCYTAKYAAADGALLWEQRYNGPGDSYDYARAVALDGDGNVVVTGTSVDTSGYGDCYTAKYAAVDGALLWEQRYNGPACHDDEAMAVTVDGGGNAVVTGYSSNGANSDYYTAKYAAADGKLLWDKRFTRPTNWGDYANAVAVDGSGNVVASGASYGVAGNYDFYTAKYAAADGKLLWEKRYNGTTNGDDYPQAVGMDGSGNVVVTGVTGFSSSNNDEAHNTGDYYTAKYAAADGKLLWEKRYNGPANGYDWAQALVVDGHGNVVVAGFSTGSEGNLDYYTTKYASADGALLWEKRYNGPANSRDIGWALAVDRSGNAVVTGSSMGSAGNYDLYTAKYAAADGALLWEQRYNGPTNSYDGASGVAVDGNGNVVVTGGSVGDGSGYDYYTAKYAAADGALVWEKRYNGPANGDDFAQAVAMDASGNVVVTGYSYGTNSSADYYTAKYAAADGAVLWEKRYDGPDNGIDVTLAVAADPSGNVVVTGYSSGTNGYADYYTAKYAASDGALLWERRYSSPAGDSLMENSRGLALGPNGMVAIAGYSAGDSGGFDFTTVVYWENLPPVSVALIPTGLRLRFTGVPCRSYNIERATAVTGPWSTLTTPTAPLDGLIEYVDTNAPAATAFYRTSSP